MGESVRSGTYDRDGVGKPGHVNHVKCLLFMRRRNASSDALFGANSRAKVDIVPE
jgi:hypothetical protein